jgi:prepilin-type N-terminal cleavage/methylation domain-containing protein
MGKNGLKRHQGFTLVEIAIVLVIIGVILGGVLNARSVIRNAHNKDIVKAVADVATAAQQFRDRYGAWPGDLINPVSAIPDLSATCVGNGNGVINTGVESTCATEELIRSSMLRGDALAPLTLNGTVVVSLTNRTAAAALPGLAGIPASWINVVRVQNIDCDTALQIDRAVDDASGTTGNFRIGTACLGQNESVLVANAVLRLN